MELKPPWWLVIIFCQDSMCLSLWINYLQIVILSTLLVPQVWFYSLFPDIWGEGKESLVFFLFGQVALVVFLLCLKKTLCKCQCHNYVWRKKNVSLTWKEQFCDFQTVVQQDYPGSRVKLTWERDLKSEWLDYVISTKRGLHNTA